MKLQHITGLQQFTSEVENFAGIALVDFRAPRCRPCQMLGPIIEEIAEEYKDNPNVKIIKVDVENQENQELAMKYQIRSIPCVYILKQGQIAENIIGLRQKEEYKNTIDKLL